MNLARLRDLKGLTQADLSEMIGVSQSTLSRAESGHHTAKLETFQKCADVLGVPLADLFIDPRSEVEDRLLAVFRSLSPDMQRVWMQALEAAGSAQQESE